MNQWFLKYNSPCRLSVRVWQYIRGCGHDCSCAAVCRASVHDAVSAMRKATSPKRQRLRLFRHRCCPFSFAVFHLLSLALPAPHTAHAGAAEPDERPEEIRRKIAEARGAATRREVITPPHGRLRCLPAPFRQSRLTRCRLWHARPSRACCQRWLWPPSPFSPWRRNRARRRSS